MNKVIQFDVDGVLADFVLGFTAAAGIPPYSTRVNTDWDFNHIPKEQRDAAWEKIKSDPHWWERLAPLVPMETMDTIERLSRTNFIVFVTSRASYHNVQLQTVKWLRGMGLQHPSVVVSGRKGDIALAINADYSIDDRAENAACVRWIADRKPCRSYLLDGPYNQQPIPSKVKRVITVDEFLNDIIEEGK